MSGEITEVKQWGTTLVVSDEVLAAGEESRAMVQRWFDATPEERARWTVDAKERRSAERAAAERAPLTVDALLDKLGFSRAYAEHLVQPYCGCDDSADGWSRCAHADDEGVE